MLGGFGVILSNNNLNTGWILTLDKVLFFIPFFAMGTLYQKYKKYDKLNNLIYFSIILIIAYIIIYFNDNMPTFIPSNGEIKSSFILMPYIVGMLGTAFWFRIAKILTPSIGKSKSINLIADNTYTIMINQLLGFKIVESCFALIHHFTNYCANFNMELYKTSWQYCYVPNKMEQMHIIYVAAAIIFSIWLQKFALYIIDKFITAKNKNKS